MNYYVISEKEPSRRYADKKIALVAHIYYTPLIEYCFSYLYQIPPYIDLFITTKGDENISIIKKKLKEVGNSWRIIVPLDRGREQSALLVACRNELSGYDYIGFIHDKKKNAGERLRTVGQSFCDLLWENCLKSRQYIENVIELLQSDEQLGLLAPPVPYAYHFFRVELAGWLNNLDNTRKVARQLYLKLVPEEGDYPQVCGMTFWCKRDALAPLLDYEWRYEDFEPEPMRIDGTISHGIECVLSFVVRSQGYFCGIMMTEEYASLYECNYRLMYTKMREALEIKAGDVQNWNSDMEFTKERLSEFCNLHSQIFIYGAGVKGRECYQLLYDCGNIRGFLVSSGHNKGGEYMKLPVYSISDMKPSDEIGIVVAMDFVHMGEVMPYLRENGYKQLERYM